MKKKIIKKYIFEGLGFPVLLINAPLTYVQGEWILDINYNTLQIAALLRLCHKKSPLTGNEIRFIRKYFQMTTTAFGAKFGCTHAAVLKWEKHCDEYARIEPTAEVCIRLFVLGHLQRGSVAFKQLYDTIDIPHLAQCQKGTEPTENDLVLIDALEELAC